ncbi:MAG: PIN domain-containing protein [Anaerolineae bacterium]|nr:PIN domain-containing protein [Anaerolineae bacterium]
MDSGRKLRVMVDANILFAASYSPRFPYALLRHAAAGDFQLVLTPMIIHEAREALAEVAPKAIPRFDDLLAALGYELAPSPSEQRLQAHSDLVRDPDDIHVALGAIDAEVDYLVTQDRDFTDRNPATQTLHELLNIVLPGTFLRNHLGWSSEDLEAIRSRTWADIDTYPSSPIFE